jgi:hypothetical protein
MAADTLRAMERRGSITAGMGIAAQRFRARFQAAALDPLRAIDWSHARCDSGGAAASINDWAVSRESDRRAIWEAIQAVGGISSPAGSCLWHVVGWEQTLKDWALSQGWNGRRVSQEAASGILIAALGTLEHFYQARHPPR